MRQTAATSNVPVINNLMSDLAVAIRKEMDRQGLRYCDLRHKHGFSERRCSDISKYLRGKEVRFGHISALNLAQILGIPVRFEVGRPVPINPNDPVARYRDPFAARTRTRELEAA